MGWVSDYLIDVRFVKAAEKHFLASKKRPSDMVSLARAHYHVQRTAIARLNQSQFWYLWRAIQATYRSVQLANAAFDRGKYQLSAEDIDVMCTIWWQMDRRNPRATEALVLPVLSEQQSLSTAASIMIHQIGFGLVPLSPATIGFAEGYVGLADGEFSRKQAEQIQQRLLELSLVSSVQQSQ